MRIHEAQHLEIIRGICSVNLDGSLYPVMDYNPLTEADRMHPGVDKTFSSSISRTEAAVWAKHRTDGGEEMDE